MLNKEKQKNNTTWWQATVETEKESAMKKNSVTVQNRGFVHRWDTIYA